MSAKKPKQVKYAFYDAKRAKSMDIGKLEQTCDDVAEVEELLFHFMKTIMVAVRDATDLEVLKRTLYLLVKEDKPWKVSIDDLADAELVSPEQESDD